MGSPVEDIKGLRSKLENFHLGADFIPKSSTKPRGLPLPAPFRVQQIRKSLIKPGVQQPRLQNECVVEQQQKAGAELQPLLKPAIRPVIPAAQPLIPTSAETLLSSLHGRDMRNLRKIGKRDLQAAVKYGVKELAKKHPKTGAVRYKFTYANIVYITDEFCKKEVTSWVEPIEIPEAYVTPTDVLTHEKLTQKFKEAPSLVSSHAIFVVDQSGSMGNHDVEQYKTRSDAVFGTLALDFVGKQIDEKNLRHTDIASLILMRDDSEVVIEREPLDNVFFNKVLRQMKQEPFSHGNYLPALRLAKDLLQSDQQNSNCALTLVFLSDGRPSDHLSPTMLRDQIESSITDIASSVSDRLGFYAIGFGSNVLQFELLKHMTTHFKAQKCNASFHHMKGDMQSLSLTVSTLSSSVVAARTIMSEMGGKSSRTPRKFEKENRIDFHDLHPDPEEWDIYSTDAFKIRKSVWDEKIKDWIKQDISRTDAIGIRRKSFAQGAERIVYTLGDILDLRIIEKKLLLATNFVAKESRFVEDDAQKMDYHKRFCITQMKSERIAKVFNSKISELKKRHPYLTTANITFLDCWVYTMKANNKDDASIRRVLCEKYLDGTYKKWNSNNGYVDGGALPLQYILEQKVEPTPLDAIVEESSEEETSDCELDNLVSCLEYDVKVEDYPQAFSHFSYRHSRRKILVCDLQGVLDSTQSPPLFELTDPVIHYSSSHGRKRNHKYGRTDLGAKGINQFFFTHKCNNVCKLLGITGFQPR